MAVDSVKPEPILDLEGTLSRFGGDKDLFVEMSGMLLEDAPRLVTELRCAVAAQDAMAIRMRAHALKGLLAGCGGVRAARAAQLLEDAGDSGRLNGTGATMELLESEVELLASALRTHCQ